jgi:hypothetical protein
MLLWNSASLVRVLNGPPIFSGASGSLEAPELLLSAQLVPARASLSSRLPCPPRSGWPRPRRLRPSQHIDEALMLCREPVRIELECGCGLGVAELGRHVGDGCAGGQE